MAAPKDLGKELAPTKSRADCKAYAPVTIPSTLMHLLVCILCIRISIGAGLLTQRVFKNGGAKWNTSYIALAFVCLYGIGEFGRNFSWVLSRYPMFDKDWKLMYITGKWFVVLCDSVSYSFRFEIVTTWFDLYQKSVKMTKRSSLIIVCARILFRLLAVFTFVFSCLQAAGIIPIGVKNNFYAYGFSPILIVTCWIVGPLLIRLLCKDMRDVTNPNWKAASAIRRIAYVEPTAHIATTVVISVSNKTLYYTHMAGVQLLASLIPMMAFYVNALGEWFSYLIFAHRRYLKDDDTSIISQYFGFTTLGVNGSLVSELRSKVSSLTSSVQED